MRADGDSLLTSADQAVRMRSVKGDTGIGVRETTGCRSLISP